MRVNALIAVVIAAVLPAPASATAGSVSLADIEDEVMCVTCNVPLNIAENPQATRQREFIRRLIDRGLTKQEIKLALVAEYGANVLALPDSGGFGITAYAVPLGLVAMLGTALLLLLPRWRSRPPADIGGSGAAVLSDADARRLAEDLDRYEA